MTIEEHHLKEINRIKTEMIDTKYIKGLSSFFKVIGEESRVKIIYALSICEMCVNDLAEILDMSQSSVSHQLKLLKLNGQVKSRREGKNIFYSLDDQHVVKILTESLRHVVHKMDEGKL